MLFNRRRRTEDFEAAALPFLDELYRAAARLLGDAGKADDIVQDVYLQAWKSFDKFEPGTNCRAWLYKILFHTVQHYRRKWMSFRMVAASDESLVLVQTAPAPIAERITDQEMLAALTAVPEDFRSVVLLVDVEEFSYKDAAGILNVPVGTVMSRLSRGRALLRQRLAQMAGAYGIGRTNLEGQPA